MAIKPRSFIMELAYNFIFFFTFEGDKKRIMKLTHIDPCGDGNNSA